MKIKLLPVLPICIITILCIFLPLMPELHAQGARTPAERSLTIDETLRELGAVLSWDPFFASGVLNRGENRLKFYSGMPGEQGMVLFNNRELINLSLPFLERGLLRFPESFVAAAKRSFSVPAADDAMRFRIAAIIIDPGHGGRDPGAIGNHTINGRRLQLQEKNVVLTVSRELAELLRRNFPDKRILLTRSGDTNPSHENRVHVANTVPLKDNEIVIFVSVHANASRTNANARGFEVWHLPPQTNRQLIDSSRYAGNSEIVPILNDMLQEEYMAHSIQLGRTILGSLGESFGNRLPSRGLKAENWYVVRNARMPAVLVELAFVSNSDDARLMSTDQDLKLFSEALYKGIIDFVNYFERPWGL